MSEQDKAEAEAENRPLDEEGDEPRHQRPMEVDPSLYYETGRLNVMEGPPGRLPEILGDPPPLPDPGMTVDSFVCNAAAGRLACEFYGAVLLPAAGSAKGFSPMRQIRRFCTRLATASELFELEGDVYACTLRRPLHESSTREIEAFEERQRKLAEEVGEKSGSLEF